MGYHGGMSDVAARHARFQLSLAALVILITLLVTGIVMAFTDSQFWPTCAVYFYLPFAVGLIVGRRSKSRAQLLTAPPVAAAIVPPLPVLLFVVGVTPGRATHVNAGDLFRYCVLWFPILLVLEAPSSLAGSVVGYWFTRPRQPRTVRS